MCRFWGPFAVQAGEACQLFVCVQRIQKEDFLKPGIFGRGEDTWGPGRRGLGGGTRAKVLLQRLGFFSDKM